VHPTAMQDMRSCAICQFPRVGTRGSKNGSHRDRTSSSSSRNGAKISHMTPPTRSQQEPSGKRVGQCDIGEAACGGTKCAGKICRQSSEVAVLRCNPLLCLQCVFSLLVQLEVGGLAGSFFFLLQQQWGGLAWKSMQGFMFVQNSFPFCFSPHNFVFKLKSCMNVHAWLEWSIHPCLWMNLLRKI
jgi:hypothetical protein